MHQHIAIRGAHRHERIARLALIVRPEEQQLHAPAHHRRGDHGLRQQLGRGKLALHVRIQAHEILEPAPFKVQLPDRRHLQQQLLQSEEALSGVPCFVWLARRVFLPRRQMDDLRLCHANFSPFRDGQRVAAVVVHIVGVTLDPDKLHLVRLQQGVERLPEVGVFQLALLAPPALLLPAAQPAEVDGVSQILTVRIQRHLTRLAQALQRGDRAEQLHAVVRRGRLAAGELRAHARRISGSRPQPPGPGLPEQAPSV